MPLLFKSSITFIDTYKVYIHNEMAQYEAVAFTQNTLGVPIGVRQPLSCRPAFSGVIINNPIKNTQISLYF